MAVRKGDDAWLQENELSKADGKIEAEELLIW
jgi:hypothetical protein